MVRFQWVTQPHYVSSAQLQSSYRPCRGPRHFRAFLDYCKAASLSQPSTMSKTATELRTEAQQCRDMANKKIQKVQNRLHYGYGLLWFGFNGYKLTESSTRWRRRRESPGGCMRKLLGSATMLIN